MTLWGYNALKQVTNLEVAIVKRAMALYGFPRPTLVRNGSKACNVWDEQLVSEWMRRNHMLYFVRDARHRAEPKPISDIEKYFRAARTS